MSQYEEMLSKSILKEDLIMTGIQIAITEQKQDIKYIQKCFDILREEQGTQKFLREMAEKEKSGELNKKQEAKKLLGIGG